VKISARALLALTALLALPLAVFALRGTAPTAADAQSAPILTSPNVQQLPPVVGGQTAAISGVFSRSAPFFYVSGLDSLTIFDVTDPRKPKFVSKTPNAIFENEAMTMGERVGPDGKIKRFLLLGNDLAQTTISQGGISRGNGSRKELVVVDVTNPSDVRVIGRTPTGSLGVSNAATGLSAQPVPDPPGAATTSTHTVACANAGCTVAYSAGTASKFSIFDLADLTKPVQTKTAPSAAAGPNAAFKSGAGHHWNFDGADIGWHTGSGGTAAFDVTDPANPVPLNGTDENGTKTPYNDFIHHNSQRPNAKAFKPGQPLTVENGNVVLVTEEDYFQEGQELACDKAGTFQTWEIPDLDGEKYRAGNPKNEPNKGNFHVLDTINPPNESGGGTSTPAGAFCSAHWFDTHQSGVVAQGYYQQGLRLIDVRNPRDLKQFGFATNTASQVWDAYWVPQRDKNGGVLPGLKTNIVYTVDALRGVEAFEVKNLPPDLKVTGDEGSRGSFPETVKVPPATGVGGTGPNGKRCSTPTSRLAKASVLTRKGLRLRGTANGLRCPVAKVRVAVGRKIGKRCRYLQPDGRFGKTVRCTKTSYLTTKGTKRWSITKRVRLPKGSYLVWSRAIDTAGNIERKANRRNLVKRRVSTR
jgi:hypothetical protein